MRRCVDLPVAGRYFSRNLLHVRGLGVDFRANGSGMLRGPTKAESSVIPYATLGSRTGLARFEQRFCCIGGMKRSKPQ